MKKLEHLKFVLPFVTMLIFTGLIGCNTDSAMNNQAAESNFESGEFAIFGFEDAIDGIQNATLEAPFTMNADLFNGHHFRDGGPFGRRGPSGPLGPRGRRSRSGNHLRRILRRLQLGEEQRSQIRELMASHRECIQEPLQAFREANQDIIDAANEKRRAILESLRKREIDRDAAKKQFQALNQRTRAAILNNPESETARQAMCDCKFVLFRRVRAILNEGQKATWDKWVAGLDGGCFKLSDG